MARKTRFSDFSPRTITLLWALFCIALLASVIAGLFVHGHPHFDIEATLFFPAWFGFVACAAIVWGSKLLGLALKKPENYYEKLDKESS